MTDAVLVLSGVMTISSAVNTNHVDNPNLRLPIVVENRVMFRLKKDPQKRG